MPNLVTLRPGARGTIRLMHEHGDRLVFVRYRYNAEQGIRRKTIELVVDEQPWQPRREPLPVRQPATGRSDAASLRRRIYNNDAPARIAPQEDLYEKPGPVFPR